MGAIGMRCEAATTARVSEASRKGATVGDEATVSETPDEAARARRYLLEGDPALALGTCEAALAGAGPEAALGLRLTAARAARALGDVPAQVTQLEQAEALAKAQGLEILGEVLIQLGDAHLAHARPALATQVLDDADQALAADSPLRERLARLRDEAAAREAEVSDAEVETDAAGAAQGRSSGSRGGETGSRGGETGDDADGATPGDRDAPELLSPPAAAERLLAMVDRLLERDPDLPLPAVLDLILGELVDALDADRGFVVLRELGHGLVIRAARDRLGNRVEQPEREISRAIAERAAKESIAIRIVRPAEDPRFADSRSAKVLDLRAVVAAPLRYRRVSLGSVVLDRRSSTQDGFDDVAEDLIVRFAKLASSLIVRTRQRDQERERVSALEAMYARGVEQVSDRFETLGFIGESEAAYDMLRQLERLAPTEARVLIRGASGAGKELVARMLHANSQRARLPFMAINCAALPEPLLEAELFGHAKGAFTGAEEDRPGLFERADGGTLFLDEIGDASPRLQAELLRVLQEGEVRRVGEAKARAVNVRVLAATHQDLEGMCAQGQFREDLYYRVSTLQVRVPSLEQRREDIPALALHFARQARLTVPDAKPLDEAALASLQTRAWPGNVRQLENAVLAFVTLGELAHAPVERVAPSPEVHVPVATDDDDEGPIVPLAELERRMILRALRQSHGTKTEAAKLLGIGRRTLYNKIRAYGLE